MRYNRVLILVLSLLIVACGGSSGGSSGTIGDARAGDGEGGILLGAQSIISPTVLSIGTSYNGSITAGGTVYYQFTTGSHAFTHSIRIGSTSTYFSWTLFSDAGYTAVIDTCNSFTCTTPALNSQTTYYLALTETRQVSDSYTIKIDANIDSEGALGSPVQIDIGTPYLGVVKRKTSANGASYYSFVTNTAGHYSISLTGATTDVKWELYADDWKRYPVNECDDVWAAGNENCSTSVLSAATVYYLIVENAGLIDTYFTVTVNEGASPPPSGSSQGTIQNPVSLATGAEQAVTVAANSTSYYKFNTGDIAFVYALRFARVSGSYSTTIYRDAGFTDVVRSCYGLDFSYSYTCYTNRYLDPNTTYYLSLKNYKDYGDTLLISILESTPRSPDSEGTSLTPINLVVGQLYSGKADASDGSYYQFTATEATAYRISVTGGTYDINWLTYTDWSATFPETNCSNYGVIEEVCVTNFRFDVGQVVYLYVRNADEVNPDTYNILVEAVYDRGEGTPNTPVAVKPGDIRSGVILGQSAGYTDDYNFYMLARNYYLLTTGESHNRYQITLENINQNIDWEVSEPGVSSTRIYCHDWIQAGKVVCTTPPLNPNTTYLLEATNWNNDTSPFTLSISNDIPVAVLELGSVMSDNLDGYTNDSFYQFTTGPDGSVPYTLSVFNSTKGTEWILYPDLSHPLGNNIQICGSIYGLLPYSASCTNTELTANKTYYLRTYVSKPYGQLASFDVTVYEGGGNEGSIDSPIILALPASHAGIVADNGHSYYQFTTAKGRKTVHSIGLVNTSSNLTWRLYSDPAHTQLMMYCDNYRDAVDEICLTDKLTASTTYYLSVTDQSGHSGSYTLGVVPQ